MLRQSYQRGRMRVKRIHAPRPIHTTPRTNRRETVDICTCLDLFLDDAYKNITVRRNVMRAHIDENYLHYSCALTKID